MSTRHILSFFNRRNTMKTIGDKLTAFAVTGVKPGQPEDAYFTIMTNQRTLHSLAQLKA
jgi:hypothetical protein